MDLMVIDCFQIDVVDECVETTLHTKDDINESNIMNEKESEPPKQELKQLPPHLKHAFLGENNSFPVIISSHLTLDQEERLLQVLRKHKKALGWSISDLQGISPRECLTFAYRRMPFGLCNAPATFQRCMMSIFSDMVEKSIEIFMDNFSVFGHKISKKGIEVDKAKIEVIEKLPPPNSVK
ncbi:uncharacterized protein LOC119369133, partial [Jatropha curcas]|uniref:uncharacterized protein LOC119369133 n=1 Tax=Jatropha curcas TaxID=180498 RepID=UPI001894A1FB